MIRDKKAFVIAMFITAFVVFLCMVVAIAYDPRTQNIGTTALLNYGGTFNLSNYGSNLTSNNYATDVNVTHLNQTWLEFDGIQDFVTIADNPKLSFGNGTQDTPFTFITKFKYFTRYENQVLFSKYQNPYEYHLLTYNTNYTGLILRDNSGSVNTEGRTNTFLSSNKWYHLVASYDGRGGTLACDGIRLYLNGSEEVTATSGPTAYISMEDTSSPVLLGLRATPSTQDFNGSIDYFYVYNRTIGPQESYVLYNVLSIYQSNVTDLTEVNHFSEFITGVSKGTNNTFREVGNVLFNETGDGTYRTTWTAYNGTYAQNNVYIMTANSTDGINWANDRILISSALEDPYLVYNGSTYFLYAENKTEGANFENISLYTSTDFITWTNVGVVLNNSEAWSSQDVSSPTVYRNSTGWYMIYEGRNATNGGSFGLATSIDGINWSFSSNNPVLTPSYSAGTWDNYSIVPDDIYLENGLFYISYHGNNFTTTYGGYVVTPRLDIPSSYRKYFLNPVFDRDFTIFYDYSTNNYRTSYLTDSIGFRTGQLQFKYPFNSSYMGINQESIIFEMDLNENSGTTAYDVSGNSNNGTITSATWNNDGVNIQLTKDVDYNLSGAYNQIFTLANSELAYSNLTFNNYTYNYEIVGGGGGYSQPSSTTTSTSTLSEQDEYIENLISQNTNLETTCKSEGQTCNILAGDCCGIMKCDISKGVCVKPSVLPETDEEINQIVSNKSFLRKIRDSIVNFFRKILSFFSGGN